MAAIGLHGVRRVTSDGSIALDGVDLDIADGELLGVLGPSGSGKSALLRAIAGVDAPTGGVVHIGGNPAAGMGVRDRNVVVADDADTLLGVLSVIEELALPPELRRLSADAHDAAPSPRGTSRTDAAGDRRQPGARRRRGRAGRRRQQVPMVAGVPRDILRGALHRLPAALLLDDPLRGLDPSRHAATVGVLQRFHQATGITTILATHRQGTLLAMADRVAVMRAGHVEQVDSPGVVVRRPANAFVAGFIGDPPPRLVTATVAAEGGVGWLELGHGARLRYPGGLPGPLKERIGTRVAVSAGPETVRSAVPGADGTVCLTGGVVGVTRRG